MLNIKRFINYDNIDLYKSLSELDEAEFSE